MEKQLNGCLILFEVTGQQYFSLRRLTSQNFNDRPTFLRTIYLLILLVAMVLLMMVFLFSDNAINAIVMTAKNLLIYGILSSLNVGLMLVMVISLVQSYLSTQKTKKIFINLKMIGEISLRVFDIVINYKNIRNYACRRAAFMAAFFLTTHAIATSFHCDSFEEAYPLLVGSIPVFVLYMIIYKFIFYVQMINCELVFLEKLLTKVFEKPQQKVPKYYSNRFLTVKPVVPLMDEPLRRLRAARKIYNIIYENGLLVNQSNGLTILILLMDLVVSLTATGYEIYVIAIGGLTKDLIPGGKYFSAVCFKN